MVDEKRIAVVAGATGLIGGHLLDELLARPEYSSVVALVRRALGRTHAKLEERIVDFDALESLELPARCDVFIALGTTMKRAGSQAAFRAVDYEYVVGLARAGARADASALVVVSSVGADPHSRTFYLRVKGEMEEAVRGERYDGVHILRPSALVGDRKETRLAERFGIGLLGALSFAMRGPLRRYRSIPAKTVAEAMVAAALSDARGVNLYEYDAIVELTEIS